MVSKGSPPYRVLYLHGHVLVGGAKQDLLTIVSNLDRTRFEPIVASEEGAVGFREALARAQVHFIPIPPLPGWRKTKFLLWQPLVVFNLYRLLVRERIDILHVNDYWWAPQCLLAARLAGIKCVVHIRLDLEGKRVWKYWLTRPDHLIACSEAVRVAARAAGVPTHRISLIYSGLPEQRIKMMEEPCPQGSVPGEVTICQTDSDTRVIGTVARLVPVKGIDTLLRAFRLVRSQYSNPLKLLIVGGEGLPGYETRLRELASHLSVADATVFTGHQDQDNVLRMLATMDIFVLPSLSEGFPIALLEAMAMGRPVVASAVGGVPEIVVDGVTGSLVPPGDPAALAEALTELLADEGRRAEAGREGQRRVEACFTVRKQIATLESIYHSLLAGS